MTDKKLTDEEIIKRLERCVKRGNRNYNTDIVLDLINRQKAEIERLNKKVEELSEVLSDTIRIRYAEAKAEAYKEFAERMKIHSCRLKDGHDVVDTICIDNFLKEMVGEEE